MTESRKKLGRVFAWLFLATAVMALLGSWFGYPSDPYGPPHLRAGRFVWGLLHLALGSMLWIASRRQGEARRSG